MSRVTRLLIWALACALLAALPSTPSGASQLEPTSDQFEDALPEGATLTGKEIYERFLDNKLTTAVQHQYTVATDPGGERQETHFWVRWKDFRDEERRPDPDGVTSKTLIKISRPLDMRNTGFLLIDKGGEDSEQFAYRPSMRKTKRVKLDAVTLAGTDYSFADIAFQDIDDADYTRRPDEEVSGIPVYVVEAIMKPEANSQYKKTVTYMTTDHYVPLRGRFWDHSGVEIKEMIADPDSVKEFDGVWIATAQTMTNLQQKTKTNLYIKRLEPDKELPENMFSVSRLPLLRAD
jgi:hypothetical protein